ncbi:dethiobiotin synthase [Pararhodospirillum photometricum]|uniref:ATP-dependent dethiobiotin synthetase BioD n=1 Tax=Pararhodospirillum photometricum DSM 122 TaxID=1150469 RepID=H6SJ11_PARPM|nr:dethiobiotin synthase [Pararhodospirillum photometricum]CCG07976.1 Dethiobiotin synthetase [Pararhodospirillum photometricum DSM 122]
MSVILPRRLVVSGTDTGIGKTVVAAALTQALNAAYWKPVQAGLDGETDSATVARLAGVGPAQIIPEAWRLTTPASPHRAAALDGVTIDLVGLVPPAAPSLVIEGAGGVMTPLTRCDTFADLFALWRIPVVLVARTALGTLNHTLLALEALGHRDVPVVGVAFVGDPQPDTEALIPEMTGVPRLGRLPVLPSLTPDTLRTAFLTHFPDVHPAPAETP